MNKNVDIEEMIADAKAEEEVAREQAKAAKEEKAREDFRNALRKGLNEALSNKDDSKITVSLDEYLILKFKERDLEKIVNKIVAEFKLSYDKEYLRINDADEIVNAFKVIYPEAYEAILEDLIEKEQSKEG